MVCVSITGAYAQTPLYLKILIAGENKGLLEKNITPVSSHEDSVSLQKYMKAALLSCYQASFLQASVTDIRQSGDTIIVQLNPGPAFQWIKLGRGNVGEDLLSAAGFRESAFYGKPVDHQVYTKRIQRMLNYLEANGYPFAMIRLDSVEAGNGGLSAILSLDKNRFIVFDTIAILGGASINKRFLNKYLGIKEGAPYNENLIRNAGSRLSQLPFLKTVKMPSVYFYGGKALPFLYLDNKRASTIDGIIGFAPNSQVNNELLITGEANLKLQNLFSRGVSFDLNYRSFLANSQDLKLKTVYPYIFNTSLALDYELNLLKLDSTFLDVRNELGLQYRFIGTDYFKVFYSIQSTVLIEVDTQQIKLTRRLPESSDLRNDQYGLGFKVTRYDYFLNPRSGFSAEATAAVGIKKILRNPTIDDLKFSDGNGAMVSLYDTIKLQQVQYRLYTNADVYFPFGSNFTFRTQLTGGYNVAENLFFNELFRIGGIRTLKGFDEQSIFASGYLVANTELRYLLQQNSNVMIFWNGAWYENKVRVPVISDNPYGFGAGINFETGAGIFSLYYAVGKQFNNPVQFENAKIHFGFVTIF